ncbi:TPA: AAA family ATPase [Streptococcus suis]|nr:AAA family ATPase [Streptococcus suis]
MIICLNGPFGVGKTTLANILHKRIENSYLYDPELLGDFLQHQLPQTVCPEDFQDYSVWRQTTYKADKTTILERLDNRVNEDNIWAKRHLDVCLKAFESHIPGQRLNTDSLKPEEVAKEILMLSEITEE